MKQLIVMISMVVLGIALAVMIMGFKAPAQTIVDNTSQRILETVDAD